MTIVLLVFIYLMFVSLGLPDSMLGSSFPAIADNLAISSDTAGYIGMTVSVFTIISALLSSWMIERFSTKWVVSFSVMLTAVGLLGFSFVRADTWYLFFLCAVPLGLGAGAIDSALNNYVSLHYKAIHMNWLHASWGLGTIISPLIIGSFIDSSAHSQGWGKGVRIISIIQFSLMIVSFLMIPIWNKALEAEAKEDIAKDHSPLENTGKLSALFQNPVFYLAMVGFFCYCGLETTTGLWSGRYFVSAKGFTTSQAASLTSFFYLGITLGRVIAGPFSLKIREKALMRIGESLLLCGVLLTLLPFSNPWVSVSGILIIGIGCAPIYPAIIRSTPYRFSRAYSQKAMGLEMAIAYCGNLLVSPLFGLMAKQLGERYSLLPYAALILALIMIITHEAINLKLRFRDAKLSDEEKKNYLAA